MWETYPRLSEVPQDTRCVDLAQSIGRQLLPSYTYGSLDGIAAHLNWQYREDTIGKENSTVQALLVPLRKGDFSLIINKKYQFTPPEKLRLVGHEIAHSLFYAPGYPPRRIISHSLEEEVFCDKFADYLATELL
jgi:hypothetical protein